MQTIKLNNAEYKVQISNFRGCHAPGFELLHGCHGKDQKECKACILFTVAAIITDNKVYTGLAKRSKSDQFCNKTGRSIAIGRALKSMVGNVKQTQTFDTAQEFVDQLKKWRKLESACQVTPGVHNNALLIAFNDLYHVQPKRA